MNPLKISRLQANEAADNLTNSKRSPFSTFYCRRDIIFSRAPFLTAGGICDSIEMMRYRLRTLLIVMAILPPLISGLYFYPAVFGFIGGLVVFSCWVAAIGGIFGKVGIEGGILAFACLLLLALFLPANHGSRQSPTAATQVTVTFFNTAINSYRDKVGQLPSDLESLLKPPRDLPDGTSWGGPYLDYVELPLDKWGGRFQYKVLDSANGKFRVWSNGPDRRSGTADDISDR